MLRFSIAAIAVLSTAILAFYAGVFQTAFHSNMCYSAIISELGQQAQAAAATQDPAAMERYARKLQSLPLHGYESDCHAISAALARPDA
ncbi:hypothetical protein [Janthinobacterium sp. 1_2014MBL_MicDiv]|uniref:hypothetical protein n=1 Tax=Janthinobacterium sp. 1_2014MBL_MicDiv TaxID=1644131 RepID=UPI0008F4DA41|nr:hypothetical protein [Janthinobacterium sp. 1_2014MBL_MicDiv]APA67317.1 hypothetical protein YQ44_05110 [Janthinobacterium sp. 1_2014MBL_MicDiv]